MKIQAVIFDMDGLMIDSEAIQLKAMNNTLKKYHITISEAEWCEMAGKKTKENIIQLEKKYNLPESYINIEKRKNFEYRKLIKRGSIRCQAFIQQ